MPVFSTGYVGALYPPNALYLLLAPVDAGNVLAVFHSLLAGVGMLLYLRRGRLLAPGPALCGALAFQLSGFFLAHAGHVSMAEAGAAAPWIGWLALRAQRRASAGSTALFAAAFAAHISIGYLQHTLFAVLWVGWDWVGRLRVSRRAAAGTAAVAFGGLLGAGCMVFLLVSGIDHAASTPRSALTLAQWADGPFPPSYLAMFLAPSIYGLPLAGWNGSNYAAEQLNHIPPVFAVFAAAALLLALRSRWRRRREVLHLTLGGLIALAVAGGTELPYGALLFDTPPFSLFRVPARWMFLATAFAATTSAFGLAGLWRRPARGRAATAAAGFALAAVASIGAATFLRSVLLDGRTTGAALWERLSSGDALLLAHAAFLAGGFALLTAGNRFPRLRVAALAALLCAEWRMIATRFDWVPRRPDFFASAASHPVLSKVEPTTIQRLAMIAPLDPANRPASDVAGNCTVFMGIPNLAGACPMLSRRLPEALGVGSHGGTWLGSLYLRAPDALELMGVSHFHIDTKFLRGEDLANWDLNLSRGRIAVEARASGGSELLARLLHARPLLDWAPSWEAVAAGWQSHQRLRNEDGVLPPPVLRKVPIAADYPHLVSLPSPDSELETRGKITPLNKGVSFRRFRLETERPGLLLIRQVHWPGCEYRYPEATDEFGEWRPTAVAYGLMQAVPVPAGRTVFEWRYRPPRWGLTVPVSLAFAAAVVGLALIEGARRPRLTPRVAANPPRER
ncbi:MAG: hypothetical protein SF028_03405 [Candidatus Sumerlaeia bacterium]|nr:hypothetical protein [Candidatus Sumerlaeia bacterium]